MNKLLFLVFAIILVGVQYLPTSAQSLTQEDIDAIYGNTVFFENSSACSLGGYGESLSVTPGQVYIIGDSIVNGARSSLASAFTSPWSVVIDAADGRRTGQAPDIITGEGKNTVAIANAVVVALGANDGGANITTSIEETVDAIRALNSTAPIFWVDTAAVESRAELNGVNESIYDNASKQDYNVISWFREVFDDQDPTSPGSSFIDTNNYIKLDSYGVHPVIGIGTDAFAATIFNDVSKASNIVGAAGVGGDNRERAYNYFQSVGFTAEQAAGIVGNLMSETAGTMDPSIEQGHRNDGFDADVARGYGLAQWTSTGRKHLLEDFAAATSRPIDSFEMQLDFILFEMTGEPAAVGLEGGRERGAFIDLKKQTTVEDSAVSFARKYERNSASLDELAGKIDYDTAYKHRIGNAIAVFEGYASGEFISSFSSSCDEFNLEIIAGNTVDVPCEGLINGEYEANGYKEGKLVLIRVCVLQLPDGENGPHVNSQLSGAISQLLFDSWNATDQFGESIHLTGGGFRTMAGQIAARERNGCPDIYDASASSCRIPTARPGYSNHQMGFAIDFHNVPKCPSSTTIDGKKFCQVPGNPKWEWLTANASAYGLQQLRTEGWHWSIDGH